MTNALPEQSHPRPFLTMTLLDTILERRAQDLPVHRFDLGEPGEEPPAELRHRLAKAIETDRFGYSPAMGLPELRQRISQWYQERHGVSVDPRRIAITSGATGALLTALTAAFDQNDRIVTPTPGYPAYRNMLSALRLPQATLTCGPAEGFRFTADVLARAPADVSGAIFASPANPTGVVLTNEETTALVRQGRDQGVRLISDEIYHGLTFTADGSRLIEPTLAGEPDAFVVNSFSKLWRLPGWRLGWLVSPEDMVDRIDIMAQTLFLGPSTPAQRAALYAFDHRDEAVALTARYGRNLELARETLARAGVEQLAAPDGAFYIWADFARFADDGFDLCLRLLKEAGVAVAPGVDFDPEGGRTWVRMALVGDEAQTVAGLAALEDWLARQPRATGGKSV